jgi:hypothetical protein
LQTWWCAPETTGALAKVVEEYIVNPETGRYDNTIEGERAEGLLKALQARTAVPGA